jgi:oligosaccharide repeat unit polymerase
MLGIYLITRKIPIKRTVLAFLLIGLAIFVLVGIYQHDVISLARGYETNEGFLLENFQIYLLGTIPALDNVLNQKAEWSYGAKTFRSVFAVLSRMQVQVRVAPLVQEFTYIPFPINVYTVYQPYYLDFGYPGIALFILFIGYIHGIVYKRAITGRSLYVFAYGLLLYPLFMQFFQDQYASLLTTWILITVILRVSFIGKKT